MAVEEPANSLLTWILGGISAVLATLATTIGYLYRKVESDNASQIQDLRKQVESNREKADNCHEDRLELHAKCASLDSKVCYLEQTIVDLQKNACIGNDCKRHPNPST